jgi:histidinol-phosphate aminotransferase
MSWREHVRESVWGMSAYRPFDYASASPGIIRLDANEAAYPLGREELDAFQAEMGKLPFHRYPEVSGRPLREALALRWKVDPAQILLGNGSDEIISILMTAFGGGTNGARAAVLYPTPTFGEYEAIALAHGARPLPVPLDEGFRLDEPRLADAVRRARPALAFFASPNNPTGNHFDAGVLERLARQMDAVLVVDEAYADFGSATMLPLVGEVPGLFVMRSLSKIGMAGMRLGALVAPREAAAELDKVRLPYNVNALSIALACAALRRPEHLEARIRRVTERRRELEEGLRRIDGLTVFPSDANFVLIRTPGDAKHVFDRLLERGVLVRYLSRPGPLERCLRITAGTPEENESCLSALRAICRELQGGRS